MCWNFSVIHDWKGLKKYCIEAYIVLYMPILVWKICICEKSLFFPCWLLLFLHETPEFSAGKSGLMRILRRKKRRQWWSCRSKYHWNQYFPVTPANIRIKEITPSSQASDSGKGLCAHFLLIEKTYHFMKSTCISCMIITMALCSPPFSQFFTRKWKWRRVNLGIFRIQPRAPPHAGGFSKSISKISDNDVVELKGRIDWWNHGIFFDKNTKSIIAI